MARSKLLSDEPDQVLCHFAVRTRDFVLLAENETPGFLVIWADTVPVRHNTDSKTIESLIIPLSFSRPKKTTTFEIQQIVPLVNTQPRANASNSGFFFWMLRVWPKRPGEGGDVWGAYEHVPSG
jgi:hypothetical protein